MEDNNKLFEYIKNAPNEIKNALIGILLNASVGLAKTENKLLKNNDETANTGDKMQINNIKSNLLASMQRGEMNEEYVTYYYQVLEKAENFMNNSNPLEIKNSLKKYGMLLTEDGNNSDIHRYLNNPSNYHKNEIKTSNNQLEVSIKNNVFLKDPYNTNPGPDSYETTLRCSYKFNVINRIELYADTVKVEIANNNTRIINIFVPNNYPINQMLSDFSKLDGLSFTSNIGKKYSYIVKSDPTVRNEGNYTILSYNAYVIQNIK
jgi:hypothetical protein